MCQFHTWFHDAEAGYVTECLHCQKIQVCFGNIVATFRYEQFDQLRTYVGYVWESYQPLQNNNAKSVVLQTPCEGLHILLTERELNQLYLMLEHADNERTAKQLISLFQKA
jgi:hypothetical protein